MTPLARDADIVTVLRSRSGMLTKRIEADRRVVGFMAGAWFSVHERQVSSFEEMVELLQRVARDPYAAIVRGVPRPGIDRRCCRRLCDRAVHADAVTFAPMARRWIALDIDGVADPDCFAAEPEAGVAHVLELLPEPFAEAACWWQATGSAGIKPGIRVRLWFWLDRAVDDAEAKGWLLGAPVDRSPFTPVALHYVAPPLLAPGVADPVARRSGIRQGLADTVEVPAELPRIERPVAQMNRDGHELTDADLAALAAAVLRSPTVRAIWTGRRSFADRSTAHFAFAAALARAGCTDPDTLHRVLIDYDQRHERDMGKITRRDYADRTIAAALAAGSRA